MNLGVVATRYAKALLGYAQDMSVDHQVYEYLKVLGNQFLHTPALRTVVENRMLGVPQRVDVLWTACGGNARGTSFKEDDRAAKVLEHFFTLLLRQNRSHLMQSVALQYIDLYRKAHHIVYGKLVTPMAVDRSTEERVQALLRSRYADNSAVEMEYSQDPQLIGGFRLETDKEVLDASVATALQRARKALI